MLIILTCRYSEDGSVAECRILDFQVTVITSPVVELNYMLYSSITSDIRRSQMPSFLQAYYDTYNAVTSKSSNIRKPTSFTYSELEEEFNSKKLYGLLTSQMVVPCAIMDDDATPKMGEIDGDNAEEKMKEWQAKSRQLLLKSPMLKSRLLDVFDEMMEAGVIPKIK